MSTKQENLSAFARRIIRAREELKLTVEEVARRTDYSTQQWRNIEAGLSRPKLRKLEQICGVLGIDALAAFSDWAIETLEGSGSEKLKQILGRWTSDSRGSQADPSIINAIGKIPATRERDSETTRNLVERLPTLPFDRVTASSTLEIAEKLIELRAALTSATGTPRDLRVVSFDEFDSWDRFHDQQGTEFRMVGGSKRGLGFLATLVRIRPGYGAFHRHAVSRNLDAGPEFFAILAGTGRAILEKPASRDVWDDHELKPGVVGYYRAECGHAYLNLCDKPLVVYVVSWPHPSLTAGDGERIGFELSKVARTRGLPIKLKREIQRLTNAGDSSVAGSQTKQT